MSSDIMPQVLNALINEISGVAFANSVTELRYCQNLVENLTKLKSIEDNTPEENYKVLQNILNSETDHAYDQIKNKIVKKIKEFIPEFEVSLPSNVDSIANPLLEISDEEWASAEKYFKENPPSHPGETRKMRKSKTDESPESPHSFIMVNGEIYAMANRKIYAERAHGRLGEGSSSIVKVIQNKKGENFALKIEGMDLRSEDDPYLIIMKILGYGGQAVRHLDDEIVFKGEDTTNKLYTVTKLVEGKDLFEYIHGSQASIINADPTKKLMLALKACKAVQELHDKRIIHGDLNPGNFMVMMNKSQVLVQLIDFVLSMKLEDGKNEFISEFKGSAKYMAPEVVSNQARFSFASDAFALGCIFKKDLKLPSELYEGLLEENPKKRDSLNKTMLALVKELEKYPELDPESKKFIAEFKIQLIENIEREQADAELKAQESTEVSPAEIQSDDSATSLSNPINQAGAIPEPITWQLLEDICWKLAKDSPPAGIRERKLESAKTDIENIQEDLGRDNSGLNQEQINSQLRAIFTENSLTPQEMTHIEKLIKEAIPTFQISNTDSALVQSQNKSLLFSSPPTKSSLEKTDSLATKQISEDVPDPKSARFIR